MAKTLKPNGSTDDGSAPDTRGSNVANRKEMLGNALAETYDLDGQIAAALETHVKPLREAKRDIKAKLRDDLNIEAQVFNARYAAYKLEATAIAAGDEATLDNIRELYEHAPVGEQVNMMDALGDQGDGAPA